MSEDHPYNWGGGDLCGVLPVMNRLDELASKMVLSGTIGTS